VKRKCSLICKILKEVGRAKVKACNTRDFCKVILLTEEKEKQFWNKLFFSKNKRVFGRSLNVKLLDAEDVGRKK
jgi:hypothetical protein